MGKTMKLFGDHSTTSVVLKAMSIFTGVQSVTILCSIVRTKLIALWIGTAGVGLFATFNTAIELISAATQLNMRESAVRDVAIADDNKRRRVAAAVRWWALRLGVVGAVFMLFVSPVLSFISFHSFSNWWNFALLSIAVLLLSVTNSEFTIMQGSGALLSLARSTIWGSIIGTIISLPLYFFLGVDSVLPSIIFFQIAMMGSATAYKVLKSRSISRRDNISIGRRFIKLGAYITVPTLLTYLSSYIFISYLNTSYSTTHTGLYQSGYTLLIKYTGIVFTALSMEYFPRISRIASRPKLSTVVVSHEVLIVTYIITPLLIIFVSADRLLMYLLYSESFMAALPFITIGILAMVFRAVSYCMAYVILARGDGRMYIFTETTSVVIGLSLNILFFRYYSYAGLGISFVIWYALYTILVYIPYRRYGMKLTSGAKNAVLSSIILVTAAIFLKHFGWVYPLFALIPSLALSYYGYKSLKK